MSKDNNKINLNLEDIHDRKNSTIDIVSPMSNTSGGIGRQNSLIGNQNSLIGRQNSLIGRQNSLVGNQNSLIGRQNSLIGRQHSADANITNNNNNQMNRTKLGILDKNLIIQRTPELNPETVVRRQNSIAGKFTNINNPIRPMKSGLSMDMSEGGESYNAGSKGYDEFGYPEPDTILEALWMNFLGHAASWYKKFILFSIFLNTILKFTLGNTVAAWAVLLEFIFTLAMSMQCYPLQSGGLIVLHGLLLGLSDPDVVLHEIEANLNVILLLIFMVACIHFLKNLLLWIFTNILLGIENKKLLSVVFVVTSALLSAFLDALTVSAVVVSVCTGLLGVYFYVVKETELPVIRKNAAMPVPFSLVPKVSSPYHSTTEKEIHDLLDNPLKKEPSSKLFPKVEVEENSHVMDATNLKEDNHDIDDNTNIQLTEINNNTNDSKNTTDEVMEGITTDSLTSSPRRNEDEYSPKRSVSMLRASSRNSIPSLKLVLSDKIQCPELKNPNDGLLTPHAKIVKNEMDSFRAFLRSILMHCAVGTALGGIVTMVGEPQNLLVAERMDWDFGEFIIEMMPVWLVVIPAGILVTVTVETTKRFGYGTEMPPAVRGVLQEFAEEEFGKIKIREKAELIVQGCGALLLVLGLVLHIAEVGLIGLMVIILTSTLNGVTEEHEIAHAFLESMPFVSLIVVFFGVVAIIHDNHLFDPVIDAVLSLDDKSQPGVLYIVNGFLSMVSDNVFVATVFIEQIQAAYCKYDGESHGDDSHARLLSGDDEGSGANMDYCGKGDISPEQYSKLGVAIIAGTNLPSMATPNGQAAFLFILTSNIAPLVNLTYRKMVLMSIPYTVVVATLGWVAVSYML